MLARAWGDPSSELTSAPLRQRTSRLILLLVSLWNGSSATLSPKWRERQQQEHHQVADAAQMGTAISTEK